MARRFVLKGKSGQNSEMHIYAERVENVSRTCLGDRRKQIYRNVTIFLKMVQSAYPY